jgi:hypothetical protein
MVHSRDIRPELPPLVALGWTGGAVRAGFFTGAGLARGGADAA